MVPNLKIERYLKTKRYLKPTVAIKNTLIDFRPVFSNPPSALMWDSDLKRRRYSSNKHQGVSGARITGKVTSMRIEQQGCLQKISSRNFKIP
ncbi:hypothetical protein TNCT_551241 [Trichonephila clavata]|uniref:Uncharacterized protein n=1 Tax=Trichonephila clavata TaxID=2740835 RepID=A0A8X6J7P1_TRICU|nr:hypothetical protein TNCT_551241 [Trichonephila clavata]